MSNTESVDRMAERTGSSRLRGLLALNGALLVLLALVTFGAAAQGQARGRGEYIMVGGGAPGADSSVVYIVDVANQEMIAMSYNPNGRVLEGLVYRHLGRDAGTMQPTRSRPTP